jgi:hypothetical protein
MIGIRFLTILLVCAALAPPLTRAQDLSRYRGFQLGMDLPAVVQRAEMKTPEVKLIHQRPAVIQELEWRPPYTLGGSLPDTDPVPATAGCRAQRNMTSSPMGCTSSAIHFWLHTGPARL